MNNKLTKTITVAGAAAVLLGVVYAIVRRKKQ